MLTRDDTFINRNDMIHNLQQIAPSIPDDALRFELETYFREVLSKSQFDFVFPAIPKPCTAKGRGRIGTQNGVGNYQKRKRK